MARRKEPRIPDAILDQLLGGADPKTAFNPNGLLDDLKKALAERVLNAEMDHHLVNGDGGNTRNGYGKKTVVTDTSRLELDVPRDRQSSFDPQLIAKYQRRFPGFDEKIISMYARGMSVREIVGHLRDLYGVDVSPDLISTVTDAVLDEVAAWQARPLEPVYPLVFFDAIRVKIRDEGLVSNKAIHVALGVRADGTKEVLGLWLEQNEGAKFWLRVMNEMKNRGVGDILIAVVDGLKGFPEAITAVFPDATVQTCIVHLLSSTLANSCGVCERIFHALPNMAWNFDTVPAWPGRERNLMAPDFTACRGYGVTEGEDCFWIPCGGFRFYLSRLG